MLKKQLCLLFLVFSVITSIFPQNGEVISFDSTTTENGNLTTSDPQPGIDNSSTYNIIETQENEVVKNQMSEFHPAIDNNEKTEMAGLGSSTPMQVWEEGCNIRVNRSYTKSVESFEGTNIPVVLDTYNYHSNTIKKDDKYHYSIWNEVPYDVVEDPLEVSNISDTYAGLDDGGRGSTQQAFWIEHAYIIETRLPGTVETNFDFYTWHNSSTDNSPAVCNSDNNELSLSYDADNIYYDRVFIKVGLCFSYFESTKFYTYEYRHVGFIAVYDFNTNEYDISNTTTIFANDTHTSISNTPFLKAANFQIDYIAAFSNGIISYPRAEKYYSGSGITLFRYQDSIYETDIFIQIDFPTDWEIISLDPQFSYLSSDGILNFTVIMASDIEVKWKTQSNNILAISESSSDYLATPSFETGWSEDWRNKPNEAYASVSLNSTIVFQGVSSLKLTTDGTDVLDNYNNYLKEGYYYISFAYYLETAPSYFRVYHREDSSWQYESLDISDTDRWCFYSAFFHITDHDSTGLRNILFQTSASGAIVFIDDFRINEVSTTVTTTDYSAIDIESLWVYWTPTDLYLAKNVNVTTQIRCRTSNTLIDSWSQITDSSGRSSKTWKGSLEEKEYEIRVHAWGSYWNDIGISCNSEVLTDWIAGTSATLSLSTNSKVGSYSIKSTVSGTTGYLNPSWDPSDSPFDFSKIDWSLYWLYQVSSGTNIVDFTDRHLDNSAGYYYTQKGNECNEDSVWHHVINDWENMLEYGSPDVTDVDKIYFRMQVATIANDYVLFDGLQFISSQKSYFTPSTVGESDYFAEIKKDALDFTEGDVEDLDSTSVKSESVNNGYFSSTATIWGWLNYEFPNLETDTSYYNYFEIRFKANESGTVLFYVTDNDGTSCNSGSVSFDTNWRTFSKSFDDFTNVITDDIITRIYSYITALDAGNDVIFYVDWIRFVHRDSDIQSGEVWEFEESETADSDRLLRANSFYTSSYTRTDSICSNSYFSSYPDSTHYYYELTAKTTSGEILIDTDNYNKLWIRIKASEQEYFKVFSTYDGNYWYSYDYQSITTEWTDIIIDFTSSGIEHLKLYIYESTSGASDNHDGDETVFIDFIRFLSDSPVNLYETNSAFLMDNEESLIYRCWVDDQFVGDYSSNEYIAKNLTVGTHSFAYTAYYSLASSNVYWTTDYGWIIVYEPTVYLPSACFYYEYEVVDADLTTITIIDQQGNFIDPRTFIVECNGYRIQGDTYYDIDTSDTYNLTISDFWGNILYQNLTEAYERFKDFILTLYSVKVWNVQENPIYLYITNGPEFSEWVMPGEIVEYKLHSDTYNFTIVYSSDVSGFSAATTNGTKVEFIYLVNSDTALVVSGKTIQDVFDNVLSLANDLDSVNASLHNQIINVNITVSNVNTSISNQVVNVDIHLDNINSSIGVQLLSIETDISNINSTLFAQTVDILTEISNTNSTLFAQTIQILNDISNVNSTLFAQDIQILTSISNVNSTLYQQTIMILEELAEMAGIFKVHFELVDYLGIGIGWGTFVVNVNSSRQYNQDLYVNNKTIIGVKGYDYFETELYSESFNITSRLDVNITIDLFDIIFRNNNTNLDSIVQIWRNNHNMTFEIAPGESVIRRFTSGEYNITAFYRVETDDYSEFDEYTPGIHELFSKTVSFSSELRDLTNPDSAGSIIDVGAPDFPLRIIDYFPTLVIIVIAIFVGVITATAAYVWRTRFLQPVDEKVDFPTLQRTIQDPIVNTTSKVVNFVVPDVREKQHAKKNEKRRRNSR